jgi:hypothetical protein
MNLTNKIMNENDYEPLANLLRDEIVAYGKLLQLLEGQRFALIQQDEALILSLNDEVNCHAACIRQFDEARKRMVGALNREGESSILVLIDSINSAHQEMFKELVREINRLIRESQSQLTRNQMLYRRALDISRETLRVLSPGQAKRPNLYRRDGNANNQQRNVMVAHVARTA